MSSQCLLTSGLGALSMLKDDLLGCMDGWCCNVGYGLRKAPLVSSHAEGSECLYNCTLGLKVGLIKGICTMMPLAAAAQGRSQCYPVRVDLLHLQWGVRLPCGVHGLGSEAGSTVNRARQAYGPVLAFYLGKAGTPVQPACSSAEQRLSTVRLTTCLSPYGRRMQSDHCVLQTYTSSEPHADHSHTSWVWL